MSSLPYRKSSNPNQSDSNISNENVFLLTLYAVFKVLNTKFQIKRSALYFGLWLKRMNHSGSLDSTAFCLLRLTSHCLSGGHLIIPAQQTYAEAKK